MILSIHPENPEKRKIKQIGDALLNKKGVVVLPTDSIYGMMTLPDNKHGKERIARIRNIPRHHHMSLVCPDLSTASRYARNISNAVFKLMKRVLPGPYIFLFQATREVPRMVQTKKGKIGIRIPNNRILLSVLEQIGSPLVSVSVLLNDIWYNDPGEIDEQIGKIVDIVVDGGIFRVEPSTIIDAMSGDPVVLRRGKGPIDIL